MPRPMPDYVPVEVRDRLAARGLDLQGLALQMGCSRTKLYSYFSCSHSQVVPYKVMAKAFGLTLEELNRYIKQGKFAELLEEKASKMGCDSTTEVARKLRLSPSLILQLRSGKLKGDSLDSVGEIATALEMTIDELLEVQERSFH